MLRLRTLGELRLFGPAGELLPGRRKELALLAYIAQRSPRPVRRAELIDLLWGERDERRARHSLRQALLALRRTIGDGLSISPETVSVAAGTIEVDLASFEGHVAAGRLRDAVDLWKGDFLADAEDVGGETYRLWIEVERERARRRLADALHPLVAEAAAAGDPTSILAWAERCADLLPYDEQGYRLLIESLCSNGQVAAAAARHAEYTARVRRDLGLEPSAAFAQLGQRIDRQERAPVAALSVAPSAALFTPDLVGRDAQRAELCSAWQSVARGAGAVLVIEGAEGMGKTLLGEEFLRWLEEQAEPLLLLHARAREDGPPVSTGTARELLAGLVTARGLSGAPDAALAELAVLLPRLRERWPQLPVPRGDERALHHAVAQVLTVVAQEQPIAMLLDDYTFADVATRRLVLALARHPPAGLLLVITVRTDGSGDVASARAELRQLPGVRRVRLPPLGERDVEALIGSMLELPVAERQPLAARLHAETGGNPFYASEVVSAMVDEGHLAADTRGVWHTTAAMGTTPLPLPASVRDAIARRFALLEPDARHVAAAAATLEEPLEPSRVADATGLSHARVQAAFDELIARRLLRYARGSEVGLEFVHPMIRRVAQDSGPTPSAADALSARARPRRLMLAGVVAITLLVAGGILIFGGSKPESAPLLAIGQIVAAADVEARDAAGALGDMLATNLARVPGLPVISRARTYEILAQLQIDGSRPTLAEAARSAGAEELIDGMLTSSGNGRLRLDLQRIDLGTGAVRGTYAVEGADPFELADRATSELAPRFGRRSVELRIADVTTTSLAAYRYYDAGLRRFGAADYEPALRFFQAALTEDSLFAMAAFLAHTSSAALGHGAPVPSLERLNGLAARAPERERLMIRAAVARSMGDPGQAAFADSLAERYPAETEGHLGIGSARVHDGDFLGAMPHLFHVIAADSLGLGGAPSRCHACGAYSLVVSAYTLADSIHAAERVVREWMRRQPGEREAWRWLGAILTAQGQYQEAAAALRTAAAASRADLPMVAAFPPVFLRIMAGDFAAADRYLMQLAQDSVPGVRREALWYLTISLRNQGRLREALQISREYEGTYASADAVERFPAALHRAQILFELERFREAAHTFDSLAAFSPESFNRGRLARHKSWTLAHLAASHAAVGDTVALTALIEPLRAWGARSAYGRDRRLHHHAKALLLAARGHDEQAAAEFRHAIYSPGFGYTRTNYELGRVLLRLGRPHEAVAVLVPALRGSLDGSNLYITRTELHALLGDAYHAAGSRDSATVHWQRVLGAWEKADAGFDARREAIRTRLAPPE